MGPLFLRTAAYGTAGFDQALLSVSHRDRLAEVIGVTAEALVYLYASCDRDVVYPRLERDRPVRFRDRFTGGERFLVERDARSLMEITAANELDVLTAGPELAAQHTSDLCRFFEVTADLLSPAARRAWAHGPQKQEPPAITVARIDHLVLTVAELGRSAAFYSRVLGMSLIRFGDGRHALTFGRCKINLHVAGAEHAPHAARPLPGSADLCFVTDDSVDRIMRHLASCGVAIEMGPVRRTGALGPMVSCYFRDPDGNLLEISTYDARTATETGAATGGA